MDLFLEEHKRFLLILLQHKVDFIIIGGYAVIYHGYERTTGDLDLWLKPDNDNRDRFIKALKEHGVTQEGIETVNQMDFTKPQVVHIGEKPNKIDFLTHIQGVDFEEAYEKKEFVKLEDIQVPFLHFDHLVISKITLGRPQDKADIDVLQKIKQHKDSE